MPKSSITKSKIKSPQNPNPPKPNQKQERKLSTGITIMNQSSKTLEKRFKILIRMSRHLNFGINMPCLSIFWTSLINRQRIN